MASVLTIFSRADRAAGTSGWPALPKPWLILPVLLVMLSWAGWWIPLNNDISWQYWIARQMRGGTVLYRDIVEVNPPLWFWEAVPISALAERLRIDAAHLVIVSVMARAVLAVALTAKLIDGQPARQRMVLLSGLVLLLCLLPIHDFAEREHLMVIGALPYTALIARRREGARPTSPWLAGCVGLFAAYGFATKPHFALVPLALEMWLASGMRRQWRPIRPETAALAWVAIVYAVTLLLFAPDYLRVTLPLVRQAYGAFSPHFPALLRAQVWMPAWLLAVLALGLRYRTLPIQASAAMVTALALLVDYFIQGKGFSYHAMPVSVMLGWALLWMLVQGGDAVGNVLRRPLATLAMAVLIASGTLIGAFHPARAGRATDALESLAPGSVVSVIATHSWIPFPLVEARRFRWPMRTMSLWMVPQIAKGAGSPNPDASGLRAHTLDMIASDLWCHPPDALLVEDAKKAPELVKTDFNYETFLRSDTHIRTLLAHYRPWIVDGRTTVYRRNGPLAPRGADCRAISIRPDYR